MSGSALTAPGGPSLAEALHGLPGIALAELVEEAAMMQRIDRKYVLPASAVPALLRAVPPSTRVLDIGGRRTFGYRSTYRDTEDHLSLRLAGQRRRRRFKVRTRAYLDTGSCWLEVKTRGPRGATVKHRVPHPHVETGPLGVGGRHFVDTTLADAGFRDVHPEHLAPVLVTAYRRTTLYLPESEARATIDLDLGWTALGRCGQPDLDRPRVAVVETKTGSTPSAIDRLLWSRGHRPIRMSKYGVGMTALHPELPRWKWHRVMEQHLGLPRADEAMPGCGRLA